MPGGPSNAQSTAWAVQGLLAAGRDPAKLQRATARDPDRLPALAHDRRAARSATRAPAARRRSGSPPRRSPRSRASRSRSARSPRATRRPRRRRPRPPPPRRRRRALPPARPHAGTAPAHEAAQVRPRGCDGADDRRPADARPAGRPLARPAEVRNRAGRPASHSPAGRRTSAPDHAPGHARDRRGYVFPPPLRIGVPKETAPGERRVALVPDVVRQLTAARATRS